MAFSFGQPAQAAPSPAQSSPFSFGASTAQKPATGGFSFGAPSQAQQTSTGGGLFGSQNNTQQQQPQQQQQQQQQQPGGFGSSLFGQQPGQQSSQPQSSSLFVNNSNTNGGLFGQQQQQPQQSKPAFSFASNNNAGPSSNTNPMTLSQMGTQPSYQQQQQNNSLNQSTGFLGSAGASTNLRDSTSQKRLGIPVNDKLEVIRAAWDVRDIQSCRFLVSTYEVICITALILFLVFSS
jgi:nuclear pore complex protein Nup54